MAVAKPRQDVAPSVGRNDDSLGRPPAIRDKLVNSVEIGFEGRGPGDVKGGRQWWPTLFGDAGRLGGREHAHDTEWRERRHAAYKRLVAGGYRSESGDVSDLSSQTPSPLRCGPTQSTLRTSRRDECFENGNAWQQASSGREIKCAHVTRSMYENVGRWSCCLLVAFKASATIGIILRPTRDDLSDTACWRSAVGTLFDALHLGLRGRIPFMETNLGYSAQQGQHRLVFNDSHWIAPSHW